MGGFDLVGRPVAKQMLIKIQPTKLSKNHNNYKQMHHGACIARKQRYKKSALWGQGIVIAASQAASAKHVIIIGVLGRVRFTIDEPDPPISAHCLVYFMLTSMQRHNDKLVFSVIQVPVVGRVA